MHWNSRAVLAATLTVAMSITAAPAVLAADAPDDVPDGKEWSASQGKLVDPFEVDAARYAKSFGTDYSQQLAQLEAIVALDKPLAALEGKENFAGSYWSSPDELVVMYKGGVPTSTLQSLRSKTTVQVTGKDVNYSLKDLESIRVDAVAGVRASGIDDILSGLDPMANNVFITARASKAATKDSARTKVANRTPDDAVALSFTDGPVGTDTTDLYGGGMLYNGSSYWCTNSFTVKNSNNVKGVLTAAHCPTVNKYKDWYLDRSTSTLTHKGSHLGGWGDVEWYTTGWNETDDFYYKNNGSRRDVEYIKNNYSVNDPVSGYGRGGPSQWDDEVKFIGVWRNSAGKLVCTKNKNDVLGDSGGPIYNANVAAGIHKGHFTVNDKKRSCFSQTRWLDDALGVDVHR